MRKSHSAFFAKDNNHPKSNSDFNDLVKSFSFHLTIYALTRSEKSWDYLVSLIANSWLKLNDTEKQNFKMKLLHIIQNEITLTPNLKQMIATQLFSIIEQLQQQDRWFRLKQVSTAFNDILEKIDPLIKSLLSTSSTTSSLFSSTSSHANSAKSNSIENADPNSINNSNSMKQA
jgi:hypothetical protein